MKRAIASLVAVLLCWASAAADERAEPSIDPVQDAVRRVQETLPDDELARIASGEHPDPWLVFDELIAAGAEDAALALSKAARGRHVERLAAYGRRKRARTEDTEQRAALRRSETLASTGDIPGALRALGPTLATPDTILEVRVESQRGRLLARVRKPREAASAYDNATLGARRIGWRHEESRLLYRSGAQFYSVSNMAVALERFTSRLRVETTLESKMGMGRAHFGLFLCHATLGHMDEAGAHEKEAEGLARESGDHFYLAKLHGERARSDALGENTRKALQSFQQQAEAVTDIDVSAYPPRFRPQAERILRVRIDALTNCASMSAKLKDDEASARYGKQALAAARSTGNRTLIDETAAGIARVEGARHAAHGRPMQALSQYQRAERLFAKLGARTDQAGVQRRLADTYNEVGDFPRALAHAEQAVTIQSQTGDQWELAKALLAEADALQNLVRLDEAEARIERSLRIAGQIRDAELQIDCLLTWASILAWRLEQGRALELRNRALAVHRAHPKSTSASGIYQALAYSMMRMGNPEQALRLIERAEREVRAAGIVFRTEGLETARADVLMQQGEYASVIPILESVLEAHERAGRRVRQAHVLTRLARIYRIQHKFPAAVSAIERAIGLLVAIGYPGSEISARLAKARILLEAGRRQEALEEGSFTYDQAQEYGQVDLIGSACAYLAEHHFTGGDFDKAIAFAREGCESTGNLALGRSELEQATMREGAFHSISLWGVEAALARKDLPTVFEFLERGRATALVSTLAGREALRSAQIPDELRTREQAAERETAAAYERYQAARAANEPLRTLRRLQQDLDAARAAEWDVLAALQRARRQQADLAYPSFPAIEDVQDALAPQTALVLYTETTRFLGALVVTHEGAAFHELLSWPEADRVQERSISNPADPQLLRTSREKLIDALGLPTQVEELIVAPSPSVSRLPFGAVVAKFAVALVPSATTWLLLRDTRQARGTRVLAIGDPSYTGRPPALDEEGAVRRGRSFTPLPKTRIEVQAVGDERLLGQTATETEFQRAVNRDVHWRSVHIACHGLVDEAVPTRSALVLTHDARNDGYLHADEVLAKFRLSTDLVVLSACETGLGRTFAGEGLIGLSRAFMLAGSPRVIASLWKVDDDATQGLMRKFYELWNPRAKDGAAEATPGISAAQALRQAQAHVRAQEKWNDPKYWAAWVLWGLPR